ncbi:MAG TPA: TIGR03364 family FAD-dependent oxidoreductase [Caulobacteraceae bacterium]|nr:TIGR03364 family FAD-dependent oxidoreductase [Caulobacteraceae bacterium]
MAASARIDGDYDLAVVGAGIVGLAHAYAAARRGARVVVIERDLAANGASIRNFGFITVTGQARGDVWRLAMRTRDLWADIAPAAGVPIEHHGLVLTLRRPESVAVAEAFLATEMGEACELLDAAALAARHPELAAPDTLGALASPHELRVESRAALPRLAAWLAETHRVDFQFGAAALGVEPPLMRTSRGDVRARRAVLCPGDDFSGLFPERLAAFNLTRCRLSMLRLADPGFRLPAGVMSDLGLVRYAGYSALPEAEALRRRLEAEQARHLANGVHLIAVQSADGSLVVGDSHHYGEAPSPFAPAEAEALILDEYQRATGRAPPPVVERWTGTYAVAQDRTWLVDAPSDDVRLVLVTAGCGASIGFGLGEQVMASFLGAQS